MKTLIVAVVLLLGAASAGAQQVNIGDSCYSLNWSGWLSNPDSILVDTCHSTSTHPVVWIKRGYRIDFDSNAVPLGWAPSDSDLEVTWQAIDTTFPDVRSAFQALETKFGAFTLKKIEPDDTSSIGGNARMFWLVFRNYVLFDSIDAAIATIPNIHYNFDWPLVWIGVKKSLEDLSYSLSVYPNPARNMLWIHLNSEFNPISLEVFDALGRVVQKSSVFSGSTDIRIDLSSLISGEYFLRFRNDRIPFIHVK